MKKRIYVSLIAFVFIFLGCKHIETNALSMNEPSDEVMTTANLSIGQKAVKSLDFYLPSSTTSQIVKHNYYSLSYDEKAEQAEWVAYELKKDYIKNSDFKRPFFIEDPKVTTQSADWRNYKNSGYDKGHLCPAADMEFSLDAYTDTFFTSNISPQNHEFNSGIWNRLEQKFRYWAVKNDGLIIITGGVLKGSSKSIGQENVLVPNYFYKIALSHTNGNYKMIAFLIPNKKSSKPIYDYAVAVDEIESMTGIDFFPKLDDKLENSLEKNVNLNTWLAK